MSFITSGSGHDYEVYCAKRAVCRAKGAFCRAKYTLGATKVDRATTVPSASVAPAVADVLSRISSEIWGRGKSRRIPVYLQYHVSELTQVQTQLFLITESLNMGRGGVCGWKVHFLSWVFTGSMDTDIV